MMRTVLLMMVVVGLFGACTDEPADSPAAQSMTGSWQGTYSVPNGPDLLFILVAIEQPPGELHASWALLPTNPLLSGHAAGSVDGSVAVADLYDSQFTPVGCLRIVRVALSMRADVVFPCSGPVVSVALTPLRDS